MSIRYRAINVFALITTLVLGTVALADALLPAVPKAKGEQCVEPVEVMRRQHMEFLLHQRDQTMHQGIRGQRHSLIECVECHVQQDQAGAYIPINAPEQFCQSCHRYSAVRIDCFQCHASVPEKALTQGKSGD